MAINTRTRRDLLFVAAPALLVLVLIALAAFVRSPYIIPKLTRDIAATADVYPLFGALSSLGAFFWFAAASILLFSAAIIMRTDRRQAGFLAFGAVLTLALWVDDYFLVHETLAPRHLGVDEKAVYAGHLTLTVLYLVLFSKEIMRSRFTLLVLALGLLSLSAITDQVWHYFGDPGPWSYLVEDGFKWLGIVAWLRYHVDCGYAAVLRCLGVEPARSEGAVVSMREDPVVQLRPHAS